MDNDIRYMYLRDPKNPKRVVTIARKIQKSEKGKELHCAISVCNPKDVFTKKRARQIVNARLETLLDGHPFSSMAIPDRLLPSENPTEKSLLIALEILYDEGRKNSSAYRIISETLEDYRSRG